MSPSPVNEAAYRELLTAARRRIAPHVHRTPVMTSRQLSEMAGVAVHFKCENFQRMGAFKMRGAINALLCLSPAQQSRGVVTHSSGNFAQALSLAAATIDIPATIVMPRNAPDVKKRAVRGYGGRIVECEPLIEARQSTAERIVAETGGTFVHPYDDLNVVAGQGTAAVELLEDVPELEVLIAPVGGGGLISGTAMAAVCHSSPCDVIGGEPLNMDDAHRSIISGKIEDNPIDANTIADGLKTNLGQVNFPIIQRHVETIIRVEETEIVEAMRLLWERMKIVVEPSAAVAFAAILKQPDMLAGRQTGVILSGGNVDLAHLPF